MKETSNEPIGDSSPSVTLTVGQQKALIREVVNEVLGKNGYGKELLTPKNLAERLKVPLSWVYEQSRLGNIPTHRFGRYIRFNFLEVLSSQEKKN